MNAEDSYHNGPSRLANSDTLPSPSTSTQWHGLAQSTITTCATGKNEPQHISTSNTVPYNLMLHNISEPAMAHNLPLTSTASATFQPFSTASAMCDVGVYSESPLSALLTGQGLQTAQVSCLLES